MVVVRVDGLRKEFTRRTRTPGLRGLLRSYVSPRHETVVALDGIDFEMDDGESLALIGPNGAGKSTTIKTLTGILHPTSGSATVLGLVPWKERTRLSLNIATVFGQRSQLWFHLPAGETFDLLAHIYEIPRAEYQARKTALVERFELGPLLGTAVRKLSLGQRMRCEIAASLLHRPRVLFLDEPTIGLDVIAKQKIRELVSELNRNEGVSVLLTSHDAGDIERLCKRVIVINHGTIVLNDRVSTLKRRYLRRKVIGLRLSDADVTLPAIEHTTLLSRSRFGAKLEVDTDRVAVPAVMATLGRLPIADITIEDPPMEEIIAEIYAARSEERGRVDD
ncbi:MAG: ATP-binding cassette domain-containing protein [Candidatus Eisenbacteria bacterium]|nr:ATP-binding cassette domain-containing protein [Candidatus Eisenbacteria bacterium]